MDQIANMLSSIKNAGLVKKDHIFVPHSKIKTSILEVLKKEGFIKTFEVVSLPDNKSKLKIVLEYSGKHPHILPRINDIERLSKLSKRVYLGYRDLHKFKFGRGLIVVSTPKGILSGKEARKELVGGEVLFNIW
ncbi:MAG: 30S ribosomal protein S8 [Candidatus Pacebacteria bacterium]|nr:30S ribosomal protein S8 [Candidatus Paceibacterota bacterium]